MINEQLLEYVKQQLSQGVSVDEIRNNLITQGGWTPANVNDVLITLGQMPAPMTSAPANTANIVPSALGTSGAPGMSGVSTPEVPSSPFQTMHTYANQMMKPKLPRFFIIPYVLASVFVGLFSALCFVGTYFIQAIFGSLPPALSFISTVGPILGTVLAVLFVVFLVGSIGIAFYKDWARKILLGFSVLILGASFAGIYEGAVAQNLFTLVLFSAMFVYLLCAPRALAGFKKREVRPLNKKLCYSLIGILIVVFAMLLVIHKPSVSVPVAMLSQISNSMSTSSVSGVVSSNQVNQNIGANTNQSARLAGGTGSSTQSAEEGMVIDLFSNLANTVNSMANASGSVNSSVSAGSNANAIRPVFQAQVKGGSLSVSDRNAIIDANMKLVGILQRNDVAEFRKYAAIATPPGASAQDIAQFNNMPDTQIQMLMKIMAPMLVSAITPVSLSASTTVWTIVDPTHVTIKITGKNGDVNGQAMKINGVWY